MSGPIGRRHVWTIVICLVTVGTFLVIERYFDHPPGADEGKAPTKAIDFHLPVISGAPEIKGSMMPWIYYSTYDLKEHGTDAKANTMIDSSTGKPTFYDNKGVFALGVDLTMLGNGWTPYLAYYSQSGKFFKDKSMVESETLTDNQILIGTLAQF